MKILLKPLGVVGIVATFGTLTILAATRTRHSTATAAVPTQGGDAVSFTSAKQDAGQTIYQSGLQNGWEDWSWAKKHDLAATDTLEPGAKSVLHVEAEPYQAVYLSHTPLSDKPYDRLLVTLNGGTDGGQVVALGMIKGRDPAKPNTPPVLLDQPPLKPAQWTRIVVPLSSLKAADLPNLGGMWIQLTGKGKTGAFTVGTVRLLAPGDAVGAEAGAAVNKSAGRRVPPANAPTPHYMSPSL